MAGTMKDAEVRMDLRFKEFNAKLAEVRKEMGRGAKQFVTTHSRRLVKKWCWLAPILTGRLRAGFWPAAMALQVTTVYSSYPNKNEGAGVAKLEDKNPSMLIRNSVPYVANAGGRGTGWWHEGINQTEKTMLKDLEKVTSGAWKRGEYKG